MKPSGPTGPNRAKTSGPDPRSRPGQPGLPTGGRPGGPVETCGPARSGPDRLARTPREERTLTSDGLAAFEASKRVTRERRRRP